MELDVQPCFICFLLYMYMNANTCLIDCHACLVSCFCGHQQCHQFVLYLRKVHKISVKGTHSCLSPLEIPDLKPPPCLQISSSKTPPPPPMPSEFQFKEPPLALGIPKSRPWYRYRYFLELPNVQEIIANNVFHFFRL